MKKQNTFMIGNKIGCTIILITIIWPLAILGQEAHSSNYDRDTLITAARELMMSTHFCALITLDESGHPRARTMDPFSPEEDLVVWFGTNSTSRKVNEIRNDSRATLYYEASNESGYVVIEGNAYLVDNQEMKKKYWKKKWDEYYSDQKTNYILIKIVPDKLEIVDYGHGIVGDSETWAVPFVRFDSKK